MLALARKYRPRNFATVAVQSHVSNTLKGAIARGRVAHGYLLCGPRGVGKTTLARVLAMALNCERKQPDGEPCGECSSCQRIWSGGTSLDVVEIDAASNRGVDDARDLRERAMYAPSGDDRYKVYIVDEAHMLTREAWNALLKILEEPPPRVVFVFATTEPQRIAQSAAPVLSRLQRFDFKRMGPADIRERLTSVLAQEGVEAEPEALSMIARAADGSMRDALSLTDQVLAMGEGAVSAVRVREALGLVAEDEYLAILDVIAARRAGDIFPTVARLVDSGIDLGTFLTGLTDMMRAQLAVTLGAVPADLSDSARAGLQERKGSLAAGDLLRMLNAVAELEPRFRKSAQQQLLLETLLVRFALLDRTVDLEDVLRGMGGSSGTPSSSGGGSVGGRVVRASPPSSTERTTAPVSAPAKPSLGSTAPTAAKPAVPEPDVALAVAERPTTIDINEIIDRWDGVITAITREKRFLGAFLQQALPSAVSAAGLLTLQVDDPSAHAGLESNAAELLAAVRQQLPGISRVALRGTRKTLVPTDGGRLTTETLKTVTLAALRKRDPLLDAAIDALDLELLE